MQHNGAASGSADATVSSSESPSTSNSLLYEGIITTLAVHNQTITAFDNPELRMEVLEHASLDKALTESSTGPSPLNYTNFTGSTPGCHDYNHFTPDVLRFYMISLLGTSVASVGLVNNLLLIYLFISRLRCFENHLFYLCVLSTLDICLEVSYMAIFPVEALTEYTLSVTLHRVWLSYVRPLATLGHIALTAGTYTIVCASLERFLTTSRLLPTFRMQYRVLMVSLVLILALITKGPFFLELTVNYYPNCTGFEGAHLSRSWLARHKAYSYYVMFWFRNVFHVVLPFFLLLILNLLIIRNIRQDGLGLGIMLMINREAAKARRSAMKAATRMLIAITSFYLMANALNVFITIWEHVDNESLIRLVLTGNFNFFRFSSDLTSLMTLICSAIRLPIYLIVNKEIRKTVRDVLHAWYSSCTKPAPDEQLTLTVTTAVTLRECEANNNNNNASSPPDVSRKQTVQLQHSGGLTANGVNGAVVAFGSKRVCRGSSINNTRHFSSPLNANGTLPKRESDTMIVASFHCDSEATDV